MTRFEDKRPAVATRREIAVTRDSVCMADDIDAPHAQRVAVVDDAALADALHTIAIDYLPHVSGVTAWRAEVDGRLLGWIVRHEAPGATATEVRGTAVGAILAATALHFVYIAGNRIAGSGLPPA